ncbi:hypothetical protein D3C72_1765340 [compost metagenome]
MQLRRVAARDTYVVRIVGRVGFSQNGWQIDGPYVDHGANRTQRDVGRKSDDRHGREVGPRVGSPSGAAVVTRDGACVVGTRPCRGVAGIERNECHASG